MNENHVKRFLKTIFWLLVIMYQFVQGSSVRPKLGFVSELPNSALRIKVNTTSSTGGGDRNKPVTIELSYLKVDGIMAACDDMITPLLYF